MRFWNNLRWDVAGCGGIHRGGVDKVISAQFKMSENCDEIMAFILVRSDKHKKKDTTFMGLLVAHHAMDIWVFCIENTCYITAAGNLVFFLEAVLL